MPGIGPMASQYYSYSINEFPGDGEQLTWEISFAGGYLSRDHVHASVIDIAGEENPVSFTWVSDFTIQVSPVVPYGSILKVWRETPKDKPLADYADGAVINEKNLDLVALQSVFIAAEALDQSGNAIGRLSNRAILVPFGETAPSYPPRASVRGKLLGVNEDGNIIGIGLINEGIVLDTQLISHEGDNLRDILHTRIDQLEQSTEQLQAQALAITEQATATTAVDTRLTQLKQDHDSLTAVVDVITDINNPEGVATLIAQEKSERVAGDTAMAATIAVIGAKSDDSSAFILNLNTVKVAPDESMADRLDYLDAELADNAARITEEATTRADAISAEAAARQALGATVDGKISAAVLAEQNARVTADSAEATTRAALAATLRQERADAITAAITTEQTARINGDAAEAQARSQLSVTLTGNINSQIQTEQTARANADGVLATTLALIGARSGDNSSFILNESTTKLADGTALGTKFSGILTRVGSAESAIASEQSARISAVGAVASDVSTLSATVNGHTTSITQLSTAVAGPGGLQAKYGVSLDVNGYITGFVQNNNGTSGDFTILADRFRVVTPGATPRTIFEVTPTLVRFTGKLKVDGLETGTLNGDMLLGTGKIVFDNGSVMKVQGIGFGSSNQFIEWFGPKLANYAMCTEANAITYLKTNGSAYFGGSLSAGILTTKAQTSSIAANAEVETAAFGSNGGAINLVLSFNYTADQTFNYTFSQGANWDTTRATVGAPAPAGDYDVVQSPTTPDIGQTTVALYRSYNGGAYVQVATLTMTGSHYWQGRRPVAVDSVGGYWKEFDSIGGSLTFNDPDRSTANRQYKAVITARNADVVANIAQRLSIIATE